MKLRYWRQTAGVGTLVGCLNQCHASEQNYVYESVCFVSTKLCAISFDVFVQRLTRDDGVSFFS